VEFLGAVIYPFDVEYRTARRGNPMPKGALAVVGHIGPVPIGDRMSAPHALAALAALGQPTRLEIFRLLMRAEPDGVAAGSIADEIGCPHNTLSSHLSILARSGLVRGTRNGRSIIYRADVEGIRTLVGFLVTDCCGGHPELCNLLGATGEATRGCTPKRKSAKRRK
jgi:ArsR family transcriptional regulator